MTMKTTLNLSIFLLAVSLFIFLPHTATADVIKRPLPEGATARFGKGGLSDIAYSPDGKQIAVVSTTGIWCYDANTGAELSLLTGNAHPIDSVIYSPDGSTIAGISSAQVDLWDTATQQHSTLFDIYEITGNISEITGVAYSPDSNTIAVSMDTWNGGNPYVTVNLYDVVTGEIKATLAKHPGTSRSGIAGIINSLAYSPDGNTIVVSNRLIDDFKNGNLIVTVNLYDVATGETKATLTGFRGRYIELAYSPNGDTIAGWNGDTASLWDVDTGRTKATFKGGIWSLTYSPDGKTIAGANRHTIWLWDAGTGQAKATLKGDNEHILALAYSPDGNTIAVGDGIGIVQLWDSTTEQPKFILLNDHVAFGHAAYSPDGSLLAAGSSDNTVRLWDAVSGNHLKTLTGHTWRVGCVAFSPDGSILASGSSDNTVRLWDAVSGNHLKTLTGHYAEIWILAFSPDGKTIAGGGCPNDNISLWDIASGKLLKSFTGHTTACRAIAFSPDGRTIAGGGGYGTDDQHICLWDVESGQHIKALGGNTSLYNHLAFSPDGEILASSGRDGVQLWDVATGAHRSTIARSSESISFSSDGRTLASGHRGGTIRLWNVSTGQNLKSLSRYGFYVRGVAFSPDNRTLLIASDGMLFLSDVTPYIRQGTQSNSAQLPRDIVRLIYLRPSNHESQQGIETQLNTLIKETQQFYRAQMQHYGGKTFTFETDENGKVVVHHVDGQFTDTYYQHQTYDRVRKEIEKRFDLSTHIYLVVVDISSEVLKVENQGSVCGIGGGGWQSFNNEAWRRDFGGLAVIPASGDCFNVRVAAHELGHAFGLEHDFRDDAYLMAYGTQERLSHCAAEWLDAHRFFNPDQALSNQTGTIEMLSNRSSQLRFQVTDTEGLHQAQLLIPTTANDPSPGTKLHSCETLHGSEGLSLSFAVPELRGNPEVTLQVIDVHGNITKQTFSIQTDTPVQTDVNGDGIVNIQDLVTVAAALGETGETPADVNADGLVNIQDLVAVAAALGEAAVSAPSAATLSPEIIKQWLSAAAQCNLTDATSLQGIRVLETLLSALMPKETALSPNYPNPFNPETWIPYQLAKPAEVSIAIHTADGILVRTLELGHHGVGIYKSRSRAAYWDGKNEFGEPVASGVYFYTLTAGNFSATRKMLIRK